MSSSEFRAEARKFLTGKWGKAALLTLVYFIIIAVISFVLAFIPVIGRIASYVISIPLGYGFLVSLIRLKRNEEVGYTDFFNFGFNNFGKVWSVFGNTLLKLIVPIILVVVSVVITVFGGLGITAGVAFKSDTAALGFSGIGVLGLICYFASLIYLVVKGYYYSLVYYILYDNSEKSGKEIVEESERLMKGNRWNYFWLSLTFIGWAILASFSFGIGYLWLMPYISITYVCFYEYLAGKKDSNNEAQVVNTPNVDAKQAEVVEEDVNPISTDENE